MSETDERLQGYGIQNVRAAYWNLTTPALYEEAVRRREAIIAHLGPLVVRTGHHTGRSPNDRFVVDEPSSREHVWWGAVNRPFSEAHFDALHRRQLAYLQGRDVFIQDCHGGADATYRLPIRVITETAWHSLFARNLFIRELDAANLRQHRPRFTVIHTPHFHAMPDVDGTASEAFVLLHFGRGLILIGGTSYAGEIKKAIFTAFNYLLPQRGVLTLHSSVSVGKRDDDVAIFFGLSGTGKTTLSTDPERQLVGDDEHAWSDDGVFNLEGGCYAKVIRISPKYEPEIYETTRRFGTILENVGIDATTRLLNLDDDSLTENTRAAYPVSHIPSARRDGKAGHPRTIFMLTADAFGVMPPVARLDPAQAMFQFLSGYTAKLAGTEAGVSTPKATFSACFGAPFMALPPAVYARLLGERIARHGASVWLVNTGWCKGPYGVGERIKLPYTRALVRAAIDGTLAAVPMRRDPVFGFEVPTSCPGVPDELFDPRAGWSDPAAYDTQARRLADMFVENFRAFSAEAPVEVQAAAPQP